MMNLFASTGPATSAWGNEAPVRREVNGRRLLDSRWPRWSKPRWFKSLIVVGSQVHLSSIYIYMHVSWLIMIDPSFWFTCFPWIYLKINRSGRYIIQHGDSPSFRDRCASCDQPLKERIRSSHCDINQGTHYGLISQHHDTIWIIGLMMLAL